MNTSMRTIAVPLLLVLALAGCGDSGDDKDGIATAGQAGSASPSATGGAGNLNDEERRLKFAECMRSQGINMPDPGEGRDGVRFRFGDDVDPQKVETALQQCKQYAPNGGEPVHLDDDQLNRLRDFAKCMRDNGVPNFPDPDGDGRIRLEKYRDIDIKSQAFKSATEKCRQFAPARSGAR